VFLSEETFQTKHPNSIMRDGACEKKPGPRFQVRKFAGRRLYRAFNGDTHKAWTHECRLSEIRNMD
jgi:hypothetical protein